MVHLAAAPGTVNYSVNNLDQYTAVGAITPTYDGNGSLTYDGVFTYGYDAESRLISASQGGARSPPTPMTPAAIVSPRRPAARRRSTVTDPANRASSTMRRAGDYWRIRSWPHELLAQINVAANTRTTFIPDIQGLRSSGSLDSATGTVTKTGYGHSGVRATTAGRSATPARIDAETNVYRLPGADVTAAARPVPANRSDQLRRRLQILYAYVNNDPLNLPDPLGLAADNPNSRRRSGWKWRFRRGSVGSSSQRDALFKNRQTVVLLSGSAFAESPAGGLHRSGTAGTIPTTHLA